MKGLSEIVYVQFLAQIKKKIVQNKRILLSYRRIWKIT